MTNRKFQAPARLAIAIGLASVAIGMGDELPIVRNELRA